MSGRELLNTEAVRSMSNNPEKELRGRSPAAVSGANVQIAAKLKAMYSAVEKEPIPDVFLDLLEKLDAVERDATAKDPSV